MEKTVLSANTILQGRYRIIQLLGHGGMGAVYEAMDENLRCLVTVKETFATDAEKEIRRAFEREASLLANIRHPAFPKVTDYFEQGDGLFFVMDFIPGDDLAKALRLRGRPFPVEDILKWADTLLVALAELHAVNPPIVHKDIKPSNLKLSPKGEIFLLDFGLAKGALGQMSTVQSQNYSRLQGHTPHFAPPEQITRKGTSPRSDLYSLAASLWCLLTNTLPPDAILRLEEINNGLPDPLRPAHELNPDVPPAVSAVLDQAMSLNSTKRPAGAAEMREALRETVEVPLRAQAELARREAEEKIRREAEAEGRRAAEEEFALRLDEERAANADSAQRLKEEHESALASLREEVSRVQREGSRALADERERLKRTEAALGEIASAAAEMEATLAEDARKIRTLEWEWDKASRELATERERLGSAEAARDQMASSLKKKEDVLKHAVDTSLTHTKYLQSRLSRAEQERDEARQIAKAAKAQLARAERERSGRQEKLRTGVVAVILLAGVAGLGVLSYPSLTNLSYPSLTKWLFPDPPPVTVSGDKLKVSVGGVEIETVKIPGGSFMMGSPDSDASRGESERPQHKVTVSEFDLGKYEVTQAQWRMVAKLPKVEIDLNEAPSYFTGDDLPVDDVSWDEVVEFCARLSKATGLKYRLPTEAEWEYAARGGQATAPAPNADAVAWVADNSGKQPFDSLRAWSSANYNVSGYSSKLVENGCQTHPVGQKGVNGFGLYDTLGNVWEWCSDKWHPDYKGAPSDGTEWDAGGDPNLRARRGDSWFSGSWSTYPASRVGSKHDWRTNDVGFRVALTP